MFYSPYSAAYRPSYHSFFDQGIHDDDFLYQPTMRESYYQHPLHHQQQTMKSKRKFQRNKNHQIPQVNQIQTITVRSDEEVEQQYNIQSKCSLKDLKTHLSNELEIPMESFNLVHNEQVLSNETDSLISLGVRHGSILTIRDREDPIIKQQVDKINKFSKELESLEDKANVVGLSARDAVILDELLTHFLEKIDSIETHGNLNLRALRKALVLRAQKASEIANVNKIQKKELITMKEEESDSEPEDDEAQEENEIEEESEDEAKEENEPVEESDLDSESGDDEAKEENEPVEESDLDSESGDDEAKEENEPVEESDLDSESEDDDNSSEESDLDSESEDDDNSSETNNQEEVESALLEDGHWYLV